MQTAFNSDTNYWVLFLYRIFKESLLRLCTARDLNCTECNAKTQLTGSFLLEIHIKMQLLCFLRRAAIKLSSLLNIFYKYHQTSRLFNSVVEASAIVSFSNSSTRAVSQVLAISCSCVGWTPSSLHQSADRCWSSVAQHEEQEPEMERNILDLCSLWKPCFCWKCGISWVYTYNTYVMNCVDFPALVFHFLLSSLCIYPTISTMI